MPEALRGDLPTSPHGLGKSGFSDAPRFQRKNPLGSSSVPKLWVEQLQYAAFRRLPGATRNLLKDSLRNST